MSQKNKLPEGLAKYSAGKIPNSVTQLPSQEQTYLLSFRHYRDDLCEVELLEKNRPKECIHVIKRVSRSKLGKLRDHNIDRIPIKNSGEYKKLFNRLTHDVELFEHKIQGTSRLFYFIAAHEFHIVAITNSHFETDKVRR